MLVLAAHPDDEVLSCGGTTARQADAGDQVQVLIVAEGATSKQVKRERAQAVETLYGLAQAAWPRLRSAIERKECFWSPKSIGNCKDTVNS